MKYIKQIRIPKIPFKPSWLYWIAGGLILINLVIMAVLLTRPVATIPDETPQPQVFISEDTQTPSPLPTNTPPEPTQTPVIIHDNNLIGGSSLSLGTIVFSMVNNGYSNLYSFQPGLPGFLRVTSHPWDDIHPALSPDGSKLAYSSRQNGYWNIYILNLASGQITPVTDTPEYDAHPAWSPDGTRILFESYQDKQFQLNMVDLTQAGYPITQITNGDFSNYEASWSPDGQRFAFISEASGSPALWLAEMSGEETNFQPLPVGTVKNPGQPTFSPDGTRLAWSAKVDRFSNIHVWDLTKPDLSPRVLGMGENPAWSPDGQVVFCSLAQPLRTYLTAYSLQFGNLVLPPFVLPGDVKGLDWDRNTTGWVQSNWMQEMQLETGSIPYKVQITPVSQAGRFNLVEIDGLQIDYPYLHDMVDESFKALRQRLIKETGWDVLANIESAFLPISVAPEPDRTQEWLYTGRAISLNTVPLSVGWMNLISEDFGDQTYWRVLVRPLYQDGSMGSPIPQPAWDINSRFNNDPFAYEAGGKYTETNISGYWVDFTDLARRYNWDRLRALSNWTTYFPAARLNFFINNGGLSWEAAMLELYPAEIFITPTLVTLPTSTPTNTPRPRKAVTPTRTPTPTATPTLRPTWTPLP